MTVVVLLVGSTTGGILVDHFGIFESPKKAVNRQKILGVLIMILGAAAIKLLQEPLRRLAKPARVVCGLPMQEEVDDVHDFYPIVKTCEICKF